MRVRVLGPLALFDGHGAACPIPRGRSSALLAALLVNAGSTVSTDALVGHVWGDAPPGKTRIALQTMVARLRQSVGAEAAARIRTTPPGYLFHVEPGELDLHLFEELSAEGSRAAADADWAKASDALANALALWKGNPLAGVNSEGLQLDFVQPMIERRLELVRRYTDAELALGHHNELVPELTRVVEAHPLRESFRIQLMLALYRSNRTADALAVYHDTRRLLARELGIDPGKELTELHERVIAGDQTLHWRRPQDGTPAARRLPGGGEYGADAGEIGLVRGLPVHERFPAS